MTNALLPSAGCRARVGLIFYSTVVVALETVPELSDYWPVFHVSEVVVMVLFTIGSD